MLFTRYHQERVRELEREVAALTARIASVQENEARLLSALEAQHTTLHKLSEVYADGIARAREIQEQAEAAMANPPWASGPLHVTEEEEDYQFMRENNLITEEQLKDLLSESGLEPNIERL